MAAFSVDDLRAVDQEPKRTSGPSTAPEEPNSLSEATVTARPAFSRVVFIGLVRCVEALIILVTGFALHAVYVGRTEELTSVYVAAIPCVAAASILTFQLLGIYKITVFRFQHQLVRLSTGWTLVFGLMFVVIFFLKLDYAFSRVWLTSWYLLGLALLITERFGLSSFVKQLGKTGRLERRTVIVGGGPAAEELLAQLAKQPHTDLRIAGIFDDRTDERSPKVVAGFPKLGTVDDLLVYARREPLDLVIFTLPISAEARLLQMLRKLWVLPVDIRLSAHINKLRFQPRAYSYIGSVPLLDVFDKPIADWDIVLKYLFDKIVGSLCLILFSPIMLLTALAVKLTSKGPILFKQKRYGFNNELIEVYKFRSMYTDQLDYHADKLVTRTDSRVTPVGRIIRKTSLDELPQLFNVVFKGNLSLVGPRPHVVNAKAADHQYDEVVDGYFARHRVKPGMTGWAQIHGWRGGTDTEEKIQKRVECDLYYIENWSILLDLYILAATPFALLKTENAF